MTTRTTGLPGGSRPAHYDRNPSHVLKGTATAGTAPHADTERWTYTVPAGRKAFVQAIIGEIRRRSAAGIPNGIGLQVNVTPSGGAATRMIDLRVVALNGVDDNVHKELGQSMTLLEGDVIAASTVDQSTTGTVDYIITAQFLEFDA